MKAIDIASCFMSDRVKLILLYRIESTTNDRIRELRGRERGGKLKECRAEECKVRQQEKKIGRRLKEEKKLQGDKEVENNGMLLKE